MLHDISKPFSYPTIDEYYRRTETREAAEDDKQNFSLHQSGIGPAPSSSATEQLRLSKPKMAGPDISEISTILKISLKTYQQCVI